MSHRKPLVSAVIPTRNRASLLRRALGSVAVQNYQPMETVVVDDGSTDETKAVVKSFRGRLKLTFIKNEKAKGASKARNIGIEAANGTFIAGLDDDDEWHPDRISSLVDVYDDSFCCATSNIRFQYLEGSAIWHKQEIIDMQTLLYSNQVGNQVLVKRERLLDIGGFDEQLEAAQDYDLWIRLCDRYGPIRNVKKPLQVVHTEHEKERISNPITQLKGYLAFYKKHKHRMNRSQRKYQLYNIRRAQGKHSRLLDIFGWVPPARYAKETRRWIADYYFNR